MASWRLGGQVSWVESGDHIHEAGCPVVSLSGEGRTGTGDAQGAFQGTGV